MPFHVVTGALGYSGKAIAARLIGRGDSVRTLTNSPNRPNPFGERLEIRPLNFADHAALVDSLRGVDVLFNTYWVRFNHRLFTFAQAIENSRRLFNAAKDAGVRRVVHVSILKPDQGRGLAYYEGKLHVEAALRQTGLSNAILRPGVLFGHTDILINNIAWVIRHVPVFGVFGDGRYKIQPMHVDDFADLALVAADRTDNCILDAVGPETFEYRDLVRSLAAILGHRRPMVRVPPLVGLAVSKLLNPIVRDQIVTREEIDGLMRGLLFSDLPHSGTTLLTDWARKHRDTLGIRYANEVNRRVRRDVAYEKI